MLQSKYILPVKICQEVGQGGRVVHVPLVPPPQCPALSIFCTKKQLLIRAPRRKTDLVLTSLFEGNIVSLDRFSKAEIFLCIFVVYFSDLLMIGQMPVTSEAGFERRQNLLTEASRLRRSMRVTNSCPSKVNSSAKIRLGRRQSLFSDASRLRRSS